MILGCEAHFKAYRISPRYEAHHEKEMCEAREYIVILVICDMYRCYNV